MRRVCRRLTPIRGALVLLGAFWLTAAAAAPSLLYSTPEEAPKPLLLDGHALVSYFDKQHELWLRRRDLPAPVQVSTKPGTAARNSYNGLVQGGDNLYFLWRAQLTSGAQRGARQLWLRVSRDGGKTLSPPVRLDSGGAASHPRMSATADGKLYVAWMDLRAGSLQQVYLNRTSDGGRHWLPRDQRMDPGSRGSYDVFVAARGADAVVGWVEKVESGWALKLRTTTDGGTRWSAVQALPNTSGHPMTPRAAYTQAGLVLLDYVEDRGLELRRSDDRGQHWSPPMVLPGTETVGSSGFELAGNAKGTLCAVWPGPFHLQTQKADIYVTCSQNGGVHWPVPARLDSDAPGANQSLAPAMALDDQGRALVVWQDLRTIRPSIFLDYSVDGGRTWAQQDMPLGAEPGRHNAQFPGIATDGAGHFLVTWERADSDDLSRARFELIERRLSLSCAEGQGKSDACKPDPSYSAPAVAPRERLLERVRAFWSAYVAGDFHKGYGMLDPFFRSRVKERFFLSRVGQISYLSFDVLAQEIKQVGYRARVPLKLKFEAKELQLGTEMSSIPPSERRIEEDWVWVDGDWYKVYQTQSGDFLPRL